MSIRCLRSFIRCLRSFSSAGCPDVERVGAGIGAEPGTAPVRAMFIRCLRSISPVPAEHQLRRMRAPRACRGGHRRRVWCGAGRTLALRI